LGEREERFITAGGGDISPAGKNKSKWVFLSLPPAVTCTIKRVNEYDKSF